MDGVVQWEDRGHELVAIHFGSGLRVRVFPLHGGYIPAPGMLPLYRFAVTGTHGGKLKTWATDVRTGQAEAQAAAMVSLIQAVRAAKAKQAHDLGEKPCEE